MIAVPKYITLQIKPANGTTLQPMGQNTVTQKVQLTNNAHGQVSSFVLFFVCVTLLILFCTFLLMFSETIDDKNTSTIH